MNLYQLLMDNLSLVIGCLLFAFILSRILLSYLARNKATLELITQSKTTSLAEQVNGELVISALKSLDVSQVEIALHISTSNRDIHNKRKTRGLYKETFPINNPFTLRTGQIEQITFSLPMPNKETQPKIFNKMKRYINSNYNINCYLMVKVSCKGANLKLRQPLVFIEKSFKHDDQENDSLFS